MKRILTNISLFTAALAAGLAIATVWSSSTPASEPVQSSPIVHTDELVAPEHHHGFPHPTTADLAYRFAKHVRPGQVLGVLEISRIHVRFKIREGIAIRAILDRGMGHYAWTTVPGLNGTVGLPGHDVTPVGGRPYGPLHDMTELRPGDVVRVRMPYATFTYHVVRHQIVQPEDHRPFRNVGHDQVVLSMCWPRYTLEERYLVIAKEVSHVPTP